MPSASDLDLKLSVKLSPEESWLLYVRCVAGMATDELMGRGPTRKAFIENLRVIADQMEAVNSEIKMPPKP